MADVWAFLRYYVIKSDMIEGIQVKNSRRKIGVSVCLGFSLEQLKLHRGIITQAANGNRQGAKDPPPASAKLLWTYGATEVSLEQRTMSVSKRRSCRPEGHGPALQ